MTIPRLAAALLGAALLAGPAHAAPLAYTTRTIPLGAPDHWDYLSFDAATGHLLIAHGDHTDIVDPTAGHIIGRLAPLQGAHGQVATPTALYADSGETGTVQVFDPHSFQPLKTIPAAKDADGMAFDPRTRVIVVGEGDAATATLIDTPSNTVRATIQLGGAPEFLAADGAGRVYINLASTRQVAVLDIATNRIAARYAVPECESPHGLALDAATHRLFVSCRNERLIVLDTRTGAQRQSLPIGPGTDAAAFDPLRRLVFSANGSGTLSIFHEDAAGALTKLVELPTAPGARTMATDPTTGRVFLVTADQIGTPAPGQRPKFRPGSVQLRVLQPLALAFSRSHTD